MDQAKKQHMTTDVKKAVFHSIMSAEDYLQAFENCEKLNLKKEQQREVIKVLMHCCLQEQKAYNPFYALLAHKLIKHNPQSYKYSFKFTLWDYLKAVEKLNIKQIGNLAKFCAHLFAEQAAPLHFLKLIDFEEQAAEGKVGAFLHLIFQGILDHIPID